MSDPRNDAADRPLDERDPLADLVSRSIGARVPSVEVEVLASGETGERKRLRFRTASGASSAIFDRAPRGETTEAQLLPFLARKTDRVPVVHSRGIPPAHVTLGPWILIEDVLAGEDACVGDVSDIVRAKLAIERAVANDLPALRALGLKEAPEELPTSLAAAPRALVHGGLRCVAARRVGRGVVLIDWRRAGIGAGVLDAATLALDLERAGRQSDALAVRDCYIAESGLADASGLFAAAARHLSGRAES